MAGCERIHRLFPEANVGHRTIEYDSSENQIAERQRPRPKQFDQCDVVEGVGPNPNEKGNQNQRAPEGTDPFAFAWSRLNFSFSS